MKRQLLKQAIVVTVALTLLLGAGCTGSSGGDGTPSQSTYTLTGTVLEERTNEPISGATVRVGERTTVTEADGEFELDGLPAGNYSMVVEQSAYRTLETELHLTGARSVELPLKGDDFYDPTKAGLVQTHWASDVTCESCHGAPAGEVDSPTSATRCIDCHDLESLRNETAAFEPNPHDDPHGYAETCGSCHRVHEPSTNGCAGCHSSEFIPDVP